MLVSRVLRVAPVRRWSVEGRCEHGYDLLRSADSVVVTPSLVRKLR